MTQVAEGGFVPSRVCVPPVQVMGFPLTTKATVPVGSLVAPAVGTTVAVMVVVRPATGEPPPTVATAVTLVTVG